jgi:hypothetical protein
MTWAAFYLACFVIGLALTLISLLAGSVHLHLPHVHFGHGAHLGHMGGHAGAPGAHGTHITGHAQVPIINFPGLLAFVGLFGAVGYLLTDFHPLRTAVAFIFAILGGFAGLFIVFWFLTKLAAHDVPMDPADYEMIGVLGMVIIPIRAGGTGEIVFTQMGSRRCAGARAEDGSAISKGAEVVVTRYERGLAYVKKWEELAGAQTAAGESNTTTSSQ